MANYSVTLPDGSVATRKSDRVYTHVIVAPNAHTGGWSVNHWCGRQDLAEKQLVKYLPYGGLMLEVTDAAAAPVAQVEATPVVEDAPAAVEPVTPAATVGAIYTAYYHFNAAPQYPHIQTIEGEHELAAWLKYLRAYNKSYRVVRKSDGVTVAASDMLSEPFVYDPISYKVDCAERLLKRDIDEAHLEILFADGKARERLDRNSRVLSADEDLKRRIANVIYTGFETEEEYYADLYARRAAQTR